MKTKAFAFAIVLCSASCAPVTPSATSTPAPTSEATGQAPAEAMAQPLVTPPEAPNQPSSNPWVSVPPVSADACLAEDIGTASDPNTGAPVSRNIDPKTGKTLCQPQAPPK